MSSAFFPPIQLTIKYHRIIESTLHEIKNNSQFIKVSKTRISSLYFYEQSEKEKKNSKNMKKFLKKLDVSKKKNVLNVVR